MTLNRARRTLDRPAGFAAFAVAVEILSGVASYGLHDAAAAAVLDSAAVLAPAVAFFALMATDRVQFAAQFTGLIVATGSVCALIGLRVSPLDSAAPGSLFFSLLVGLVMLFVKRRRFAMGYHPLPIAADFPERVMMQALRSMIAALRRDLNRLDAEARWNARDFVPLDAEVEVFRGDLRSARVLDLYEGLIRCGESAISIILGDAGSGKSVCLRKLARDLLDEVLVTGRIPIYVNLKEWQQSERWTVHNRPHSGELAEFIVKSMIERLDPVSAPGFLVQHFTRLHEGGRFFFILDSFDEIPALLDAKDAPQLIGELSGVVSQVVTEGGGRGILASRLFRQPKLASGTYCRLDIRPLSDAKIMDLVRSHADPVQVEVIEKAVFVSRPDLAAAARNPLLLTLLAEYVTQHRELPRNQFETFESYIHVRLTNALQLPQYLDFDLANLRETTEKIATVIFEDSRFGLEMPLQDLKRRLLDHPVERTARLLTHQKLGRFSPDGQFSFVHRRFHEFFLVQRLLRSRSDVDEFAGTIPEDGRWRDALVFYAEVADPADASALAHACFNEANALLALRCRPGEPEYRRGLLCLRFLAEAFRGRLDLVAFAQEPLAAFVERVLDASGPAGGSDILIRKNAVEMVGLLAPADADRMMAQALSQEDRWVRETAFRACRYLSALTRTSLREVSTYFLMMPAGALRREYAPLRLVFALSEPFGVLRRALPLRRGEAISAIVLIAGCIVFWPHGLEASLMCWALLALASGANVKKEFFVLLGSDGRPFSLFSFRATLFGMSVYLVVTLAASAIGLVQTRNSSLDVLQMMNVQNNFASSALVWAVLGALMVFTFPYTAVLTYSAIGWRIDPPVGAVLADALARARPILLGLLRVISVAMAKVLGGGLAIALGAVLLVQIAPRSVPYVIVIVCVATAIYFLQTFVRTLSVYVRDWSLLRSERRRLPVNRTHIAHVMGKFVTRGARLRYARWLWRRAGDLDSIMTERGGQWPDTGRPNYDDPASTLLAQLDERWLGLLR